MKKVVVVSALLLQVLNPIRGAAASHPKIRFAVTPMLGLAGGMPGAGIDLGMGYGMAAWGIHYAKGTDFCYMCESYPGTETQIALLAGIGQELSYGSVSFKSGIARVDRVTPDMGANSDYGPGIRHYQGIGIPFHLNLSLNGRFVGFSITGTVSADADGGSGSLMAGIPVGLLRW